MKPFLFFIVFILVVILGGISAAFFQSIFFSDKNTGDVDENSLLAKVDNKYGDLLTEPEKLSDQISDLSSNLEYLQNQLESLKSGSLSNDQPQTVPSKTKFSNEDAQKLQTQIDELRAKLKFMNAKILASTDKASDQARNVYKQIEEEKKAKRKEAERKQIEENKKQTLEHYKKTYQKHTDLMTKELGLSSTQSSQVTESLSKRGERLIELYYPPEGYDENTNWQERRKEQREKYNAIKKEFETDMKKVLSNRQYEDFLAKKLNDLNRRR